MLNHQTLISREATYQYFALIFWGLYLGTALPKYLLAANQYLAIAVDLCVHALIPLCVVWRFYIFRRDIVSDMAAEFKWTWIGIFVSILLGIASIQVDLNLIYWIEEYLNLEPLNLPSFSRYAIAQFGLAAVIYLTLTAGIFEEWLFKSVLLRSFKTEPSQFVFVIASASLFGAVHYWQGLASMCVYTLCLGVPTAIYYYRKRNLLNLIVIHAVFDLPIFLLMWLRLEG